ncbi:transglycosylase SLT domain-containing protein [Rheinheimera sp.]|uniref:transglycosylase SLT domain-containing protein n=1 Tax=Rheinheimera sp. TaxID=1869214 RepID=UPI0040474775
MKELLVFILLFVSAQSSCAGFLYDAFIDSLNSDSELLQLDQVYGYYDESKFVDSFISAVPLVQYYKTELLKASVPAYYSIIPIIESRNIRGSISSAGAGGVWQLMPSTAADFGLSVEEDADDRFDIALSTRAAVGFIKKLHLKYRNPILVLIAYNWGAGNLDNLLKRQGRKGEVNLFPYLPSETLKYINDVKIYWNMLLNPDNASILKIYPDRPYFSMTKNISCSSDGGDAVFTFLNSQKHEKVYCFIPNDIFYSFFRNSVKATKPTSLSRPSIKKCRSYDNKNFIFYYVRVGDSVERIVDVLNLNVAQQRYLSNYGELKEGQVLFIPKVNYLNDFKKLCM